MGRVPGRGLPLRRRMGRVSLYNMLFGRNAAAPLLLAVLDLDEGKVGRFRDAFILDGKIGIYTRNGGGNREHWSFSYPDAIEGQACPCVGCFMTYRVKDLPFYSSDVDDDYDSTYATIFFD